VREFGSDTIKDQTTAHRINEKTMHFHYNVEQNIYNFGNEYIWTFAIILAE
jgi:hypothetical protein